MWYFPNSVELDTHNKYFLMSDSYERAGECRQGLAQTRPLTPILSPTNHAPTLYPPLIHTFSARAARSHPPILLTGTPLTS